MKVHLNTIDNPITERKLFEMTTTANPPHVTYIRVTHSALQVSSSGLSYALGLATPDIGDMGHSVPNTCFRGRRRHFCKGTGW